MGHKERGKMEKLLQGVTQLLQNFDMNLMPILFCYISQGKGNKNLTPLLQKCGEKSGKVVH